MTNVIMVGKVCWITPTWVVGMVTWTYLVILSHTVDVSEIRRAPVVVGGLSRNLQGFIHPNGGCFGFVHQCQIFPSHTKIQDVQIAPFRWKPASYNI